jgi:hypothetical protein
MPDKTDPYRMTTREGLGWGGLLSEKEIARHGGQALKSIVLFFLSSQERAGVRYSSPLGVGCGGVYYQALLSLIIL